uniref:Plasminogen n=1 Tax=Magallana gigas TaxID=29159 RepID=K1PLE8_MAGGI
MTIDDLHMVYNPDTLRCYHWLEIQYNLPGQPGVRRCGDIVGETFLTSVDSPNLMIVTMDTKFAGHKASHKGFKLHFEKEKEACRDNTCLYGVCVPSEAKACQYKCVCQSGYTGEKCDQVIEDAKLKCTFERFERCFFDNVQQGDDFEWGPGFRHTISNETGPEDAFRGERFLFTEMSLPRVPGDKAILQTTVPLPAKAGCLSFAYNMFGRTVNKLSLYAEGPGSSREVLWSKEGNQGSDWLTATVDVTATEGMKLSFEAITGESWDSDVALDEITWEVGSCRDDIFSDCVVAGKEYTGTRDYTWKGVTCQAWSSDTPHQKTPKYSYLASESNFCRIADEPSPWCYTMDNATRWDWCSVPYCFATECTYTLTGEEYTGTVSHTNTGIPCQRWDSQTPHKHNSDHLFKDENYCRNTDSSAGPWCYTMDPDIRWELCDVPKCEKIERECLMTGRGLDYFGKKTYLSVSMEHDANFCRNPDYSSKPWCYVQGETGPEKEHCDIPSCADSPCFPNPCKNRGQCTVEGTSFSCSCLHGFSGNNCEIQAIESAEEDCKRSSSGYDYTGKVHITQSGRTCQAWSSQTPHSHSLTSLPENYCRNPDGEPAPWCYTTDPYKRWEICNISDCGTPALECLPTNDPKGLKYFGSMTVTLTGDPCQCWDSQTPHTHRSRGSTKGGDSERNIEDTDSVPYNQNDDHSRVILANRSRDYINANYIDGLKKKNQFIACQGPTPNTLVDFWSMVWQERVDQIVMLTNLKEGTRTKCDQYWPNLETSMTLGDNSVHTLDEKQYANYVIRKMKLTNQKEQYKTIFLTLNEMFKAPAAALNTMALLKKLKPSSNRTTASESPLRKEFQKLQAIRPRYTEADYTMASECGEFSSSIRPLDKYILYLMPTFPERGNYINAITIPSTTKPFAFIITKYPQPETIVDFLRLIIDYDTEVVVCMEPLSSIESKSDETWAVNIADPTSFLTLDNSETVAKFLALVSFVQKTETKNPIIVISRDGAALCGVFCAVYNLIQQLTMDEEIDVFSVVRLLQTRRPELCSTMEEYTLIHDILMSFIRSRMGEHIYYNQ